MGYYIETGSPHGKAETLLAQNPECRSISVERAREIVDSPDKAVIVVINNGPFEAAAFCYSRQEFEYFAGTDFVNKPHVWLEMDRAKAERQSGFKR